MGRAPPEVLGVFQHLLEVRLKLGASKCMLAAPDVGYLGHGVTRDRLLPDPSVI